MALEWLLGGTSGSFRVTMRTACVVRAFGYIQLMSKRTEPLDLNTVAAKVVFSLSGHHQIPAFSRSPGGLSIADAYRLTPLLRSAFEARGENIIGRKIGFTNHQM